ncbi:MAG: hypothetical protein JW881_08910 [Spirochaetales bacterium]|nr:hypothetical protein [Spirochaetales bacterium]
MDILQIDSKTIKIEKNSLAFHLHYHFSWDNIIRHPESIALDNNRVNAFFPTSVIKDTITEHEKGFSVTRLWHIVPAGSISLFFALDLLHGIDVPYFFPCLSEGERVPSKKIMVMGERLSYPSSVFLFPEKTAVLIAGSYPEKEDEQGSIGLEIVTTDSGRKLRTEICFPPREMLPKSILSRNGYIQGEENNHFASEGNLKKEITFHVLIEQGGKIYPTAVLHAQKYYRGRQSQQSQKPSLSGREAIKIIKDGIIRCLETLLVDSRGVFGPLLSSGSRLVSLPAAANLALLVQQLYDNDLSMHEKSLRLADFVLKGQYPNGMFFEYYHCDRKRWETDSTLNEKTKKLSRSYLLPPVTQLFRSARIAESLLSFSALLGKKGFPCEKYFMAAHKFLELFFDQKGKLIDINADVVMDSLEAKAHSLSCLELIFPLTCLYKLSDKDKYRKAVRKIKDDFFIDAFPYNKMLSMKEGAPPDYDTSLLLLKAAVILEEIGFPPRNLEAHIHAILPWIYYNKSEGSCGNDGMRGIIDSFTNCRIVFRGFELSYYLLKVMGLIDKKSLAKLLSGLVDELIDFSRDIPIGTPWFLHALWSPEGDGDKVSRGDTGEFDTGIFVSEAHYLLKIVSEFSDFLK